MKSIQLQRPARDRKQCRWVEHTAQCSAAFWVGYPPTGVSDTGANLEQGDKAALKLFKNSCSLLSPKSTHSTHMLCSGPTVCRSALFCSSIISKFWQNDTTWTRTGFYKQLSSSSSMFRFHLLLNIFPFFLLKNHHLPQQMFCWWHLALSFSVLFRWELLRVVTLWASQTICSLKHQPNILHM